MIKRVKIENFRSLDVDVALDPVTVLVGRSGTGKTNFVDAMRFLRKLLHGQPLEANPNIKPMKCKENSLLEYEISFDVSQMPGTFLYVVKLGCSDYRVAEEKLLFENDTLFHLQNGKWLTKPDVSSTEHIPSHGSGGFIYPISLATLKGIQKVSIAHIALSDGIGCYDFPGNVCKNNRLKDTMGGLGYGGVGNNNQKEGGLHDEGQNINTIFGEIRHDLTRIDSWNRINDSMRFLNDSIQTIDQQSGRDGAILVTHNFGNDSMVLELSRESEGCRRFFAYLLAFHQSPPKQTMFFEEPEKGLYPAAFAALVEEMKNCPKAGQGQVILTTHSPELLNSFEPESIRVVTIENGVTKIGPIATDQMESLQSYLLRPGELLTVDDARIDSSAVLSKGGNVAV